MFHKNLNVHVHLHIFTFLTIQDLGRLWSTHPHWLANMTAKNHHSPIFSFKHGVSSEPWFVHTRHWLYSDVLCVSVQTTQTQRGRILYRSIQTPEWYIYYQRLC